MLRLRTLGLRSGRSNDLRDFDTNPVPSPLGLFKFLPLPILLPRKISVSVTKKVTVFRSYFAFFQIFMPSIVVQKKKKNEPPPPPPDRDSVKGKL